MEVEKQYQQAVEYAKSGPALKLSNEQKLQMYGLFKQATIGENTTKAPSKLAFIERSKWDAWTKLGKISKTDAQKKYIDLLSQLAPNWKNWKKPQAKL